MDVGLFRRPSFIIATLLLVGCTLFCVVRMMYPPVASPFDLCMNFYSEELIDRKPLGYNTLPPYVEIDGTHKYFAEYQHQESSGFWMSTYVSDQPYWLGGDPGLGTHNPLPPFIRRCTIRAYTPELVLTILGPAWFCWGLAISIRYWRRSRSRRGFEVQIR